MKRPLLVLALLSCQAAPQVAQDSPANTTASLDASDALLAHALDPDVIAARLVQARLAETTTPVMRANLANTPTYFKTYAAFVTAMQALQTQYPKLVQVITLGPSGEKVRGGTGREVLLLRLTDQDSTGSKAKVLIVAGEHSREITDPAMLFTWAQQLLGAYGSDAQATALLRTRQIDLVPIVNPDGYSVVERGFSGASDGDTMHRKTTTPPDGVDPNRNYPFEWGGDGSSTDTGADDYRGPHAGSEPEVTAMKALSDQQHYAVSLDFHSYGRLNMWPWGDTTDPSPDDAVFQAIGKRYARWNGYSPVQSIELYPTTGTLMDGFYHDVGTVALAIETGDTFLGTDSEFQATCKENLPVVTYTVTIAADPKNVPFGPEITAASVHNGTFTATAQDLTAFPTTLKAAEYVTDPATPAGHGVALSATDGAFNAAQENLTGSVSGPAGSLVYLRAQGKAGHWGPLLACWIQ